MTRESDAIPLERLCAGENVATIADGLCLARSTVATYRKSVYRKAGVHSQCGLVTLVGSERSERLSEVSTFSAFPGTLRIHQTHISEISAGTGVAKIIRSEYRCTLRIITTRPGPAARGARRAPTTRPGPAAPPRHTRGPPHEQPASRMRPCACPSAAMGAPPTPMQTGSGRAPRRRHPGP
ncbi:LuxR C-terminal-related transcriptional regulator [Olsenella uli]|uniref:LuxR C-terminal-related transcriptional regulator n=1 Tax=Olsenella uli TaxID=133926 RepID=UPI00389943E6